MTVVVEVATEFHLFPAKPLVFFGVEWMNNEFGSCPRADLACDHLEAPNPHAKQHRCPLIVPTRDWPRAGRA
jgi:hypothetical protein